MRRLSRSSGRSILAITAGDPSGIGPEIILKALAALKVSVDVSFVVIGDYPVFEHTARRLGLVLPRWRRIRSARDLFSASQPRSFLDLAHGWNFVPGRSSAQAAQASLAYLNEAVALWKTGCLKAIVTAPVTKWAIERRCPGFIGQTEYLATAMRVKTEAVVMMFVSECLRVVLLTRHLPLRKVSDSVSRRSLRRTLQLTIQSLRRQFQIARPRLAICGLNPHAGERGILGDEEEKLLSPVLRDLRGGTVICEGPFAADGLFAQIASASVSKRSYDAVICWYHDQGLIPFKMSAWNRGAQMTLGLPVIRTSPDHGSALDIAGRGIAHPGSLQYALTLATRLTLGQSTI